jgi:hypothetical protein
MHGELTATSRLELNISSDPAQDNELVIGSITANPLDENNIVFNVDADTLPADTLTAVTKIIDPSVSRPGDTLEAQATGQRYLLTESIVPTFVEWGGISASVDDIVEFDGDDWNVVFENSTSAGVIHFIKNTHTSQQYKWTGTQWISSWQGTYNPGFWRLIL